MIKYVKVIYKLSEKRRDKKLDENIIALFTTYRGLGYDGGGYDLDSDERTLYFYQKKGVDNEAPKM